MTVGQRVSFEYHGNNYIFTVNQAVVEEQDKSERGILSNETYIVFEASNASGIKVSQIGPLHHPTLVLCFPLHMYMAI